jgi:hypothetical protein
LSAGSGTNFFLNNSSKKYFTFSLSKPKISIKTPAIPPCCLFKLLISTELFSKTSFGLTKKFRISTSKKPIFYDRERTCKKLDKKFNIYYHEELRDEIK